MFVNLIFDPGKAFLYIFYALLVQSLDFLRQNDIQRHQTQLTRYNIFYKIYFILNFRKIPCNGHQPLSELLENFRRYDAISVDISAALHLFEYLFL